MLHHEEFTVVWEIVLWLQPCDKIDMVFIIGVTREVERADISEVSLAVLNNLSTLTQ